MCTGLLWFQPAFNFYTKILNVKGGFYFYWQEQMSWLRKCGLSVLIFFNHHLSTNKITKYIWGPFKHLKKCFKIEDLIEDRFSIRQWCHLSCFGLPVFLHHFVTWDLICQITNEQYTELLCMFRFYIHTLPHRNVISAIFQIQLQLLMFSQVCQRLSHVFTAH